MQNEEILQLFRDRLRRLRIRQGLTQQSLASKLGVSLSSVSHWESDGGLPSPHKLKKIADILQCSIPFLMGEDEAGGAAPDGAAAEANADQMVGYVLADGRIVPWPKGSRKVPVVSWATAGLAHDYGDLCNQLEEFVDTECRDPNSFALILEGDSMEPRFLAGDRVVFAPNSEPRNGNFVVARLKESHGVMFKRFRRSGPEGQRIILESLNPNYAPQEFPAESFGFIYPAVELHTVLQR